MGRVGREGGGQERREMGRGREEGRREERWGEGGRR